MINEKERKKIIIDIIKKHNDTPISQILDSLEERAISSSKRTIIRDINKLIEENIISKGGAGNHTYYYISPQNTIFHQIDNEAYFAQDYTKRDVYTNFNFDVFTLLKQDIFSPEEKIQLDSLQQQFIRNISAYDSQTIINKEFERIMIEFSWKSSAIEGNTYSLLNTEALIKDNIKDETKTPEETQMILNHKDAFNESIQNRDNFTTLKGGDIEYIHTILTKNLGVTKNIRKHGVGIVGTKYKPLDNEFQIRDALKAMVELINQKESVFEKAFLALILLSYIQAFEDGNKRTARMLSNAILLAYGSIPLSYRIVDVVEYKKATILFYEINNLSYLKRIFIEQFEDAVNNYFN